MFNKHTNAVLLLADGTLLKGRAFGTLGTAKGEICFNTGMTGYQEVFTDPSYVGQVLIMNNVHIGNYGVSDIDSESNQVHIKGLIARNLESQFSRSKANGTLEEYLIKNKIVAIDGIDTRALVAHIREKGAMNCVISSVEYDVDILQQQLLSCPDMDGLELSSTVSTTQAYDLGDLDSPIKIAVMDFGVKRNILNCMIERGTHLRIFPAKATFNEVSSFHPTGYFLSNGPGDPASMEYAISTIQQMLVENKPLFGICLGHQLLALANGISTFKMHHGHRGLNHPVKNIITGQCEITTQNHGFGVNPKDIEANDGVEITHLNLNDGSIEGIRLKDKPAFSVQYHPEAAPGPHDSRYLFDNFIAMMK